MVQATPPQLPVPNSAIAALGEKQLVLGEVLNHSISAGGLSEGSEDQAHGALHLLVRIQNNALGICVHQADRQRETQLSFARFVEFGALEADAQEVQFGLGHRTLESQQQTVVEIPWVVSAVFVDE